MLPLYIIITKRVLYTEEERSTTGSSTSGSRSLVLNAHESSSSFFFSVCISIFADQEIFGRRRRHKITPTKTKEKQSLNTKIKQHSLCRYQA